MNYQSGTRQHKKIAIKEWVSPDVLLTFSCNYSWILLKLTGEREEKGRCYREE
jgi:hypothetical protein